jgi:hypothetical protein
MQEPVVFLVTVLIVVLVVGQLSLQMFSPQLMVEGIDEDSTTSTDATSTAQTKMTEASINLTVGANQASVDNLFGALQDRCNGIKNRIDSINQKIPRTVSDIQVKSVAYVPWESKENSMIQINKIPYQFTPRVASTSDCSCNYGCKWDIVFTLPIGPAGNPGSQGPQGPPGNPGLAGVQGSVGPQGNWAPTQ